MEQPPFTAARRSKAHFEYMKDEGNHILRVWAVFLAEVRRVGKTMPWRPLDNKFTVDWGIQCISTAYDWIKLLDSFIKHNHQNLDIWNSFARIMTYLYDFESVKYAKNCERTWAGVSSTNQTNAQTKLLSWCHSIFRDGNVSDYPDIMYDLCASIEQSAFIITQGCQLGLFVGQVQPGDHVALLAGLDRPVVLRLSEDGKHWLFVGYGHIDGIMDGEGWPDDDLRLNRIELR